MGVSADHAQLRREIVGSYPSRAAIRALTAALTPAKFPDAAASGGTEAIVPIAVAPASSQDLTASGPIGPLATIRLHGLGILMAWMNMEFMAG